LFSKLKLLVTFTDNRGMKLNGDFLTIKDLAKELKIEPNTVKVRIHRLGIKSVTAEALYEASVLEKLRNVPGKGRPKKPKE